MGDKNSRRPSVRRDVAIFRSLLSRFVSALRSTCAVTTAGEVHDGTLHHYATIARYATRVPLLLFMSVPEIFTEIYQRKLWGCPESASGWGSALATTVTVRSELPILIKELGVDSMLDVACGDFNWMQHVQLGVDSYTGADIVEDLVTQDTRQFGNGNRRFVTLDIRVDRLPKVDLILCRDCLPHLSFRDILLSVKNIRKSNSTYLLTTTYPGRLSNRDTLAGIFRPINLRRPPFDFPEPIKTINEKWTLRGQAYSDKSLALWRIEDI